MSLAVENGQRGGVAAAEAVVIGGGHAGMLAVGALLGQVGKVTVVERDRYPDGPAFRGGVPQARHLHNLVAGGQRALEKLLPGLVAALADAGAHRLVPPRDIVIYSSGGWHHRFAFDRFQSVSCTRPLLDFVLRTRVLAEAAASGTVVDVVEGTEVTGLLGDPERVTGARIRSRGAGQPEREMPADLVVDASGRGSRAPRWFEALGLPAPAEETVDAQLAYATRMFRFTTEEPEYGVLVQSDPQLQRGGVLLPVEGGRWILTLSGYNGVRPPTDEDTFLDYAATLAHPYLHRLLKAAEPVSPVYGFLDTSNRYRRFERRGASPDGFVVVGDAASSFNPVYGHGLAAAAMQAVAMRDVLAKTGLRHGFSAAAQQAIARASRTPWRTATAVDRKYLAVAGGGTRATVTGRLLRRFNDRLLAHCATNQQVAEVVHGVYGLALPPARLLSPTVVLRTLATAPGPGHAEPPAHAFDSRPGAA